MHQKLVPDPFFILVNKPKQPYHARNSFKNKIFWKGIIKNLEKSKLYVFFPIQSLLPDQVIKNKRALELVTSSSSGYTTNSQKFLYYLYIIWPSLMVQHKAVFELFQKLHLQIYANQCMTLIIPLSFVLLNLESVEKKRRKYKNFNISRTKRAF